MLDPEVEKRIIYIPVAEATEGNTPIDKSMGLKMAPPPRPKAPDMKPPRKANVTSLNRVFALSLMSLACIPAPSFSFNFSSFITLRIAAAVKMML